MPGLGVLGLPPLAGGHMLGAGGTGTGRGHTGAGASASASTGACAGAGAGAGAAAGAGAGAGGSDSDECMEVSAPEVAVKMVEHRQVLEDGLEIVGTKGGTLASNLPHPRADCTVHAITLSKAAKRTVRGNEKHCPRCVHCVCTALALRMHCTDNAQHRTCTARAPHVHRTCTARAPHVH